MSIIHIVHRKKKEAKKKEKGRRALFSLATANKNDVTLLLNGEV